MTIDQRQTIKWGATIGLPVLLCAALHVALQVGIARQQERNRILEQEISRIDQTIPELRGFEVQKQRLILHLLRYDQLRAGAHSGFVEILPDLAKLLPPGVSLTKLRYRSDTGLGGKQLTLEGNARSVEHLDALQRAVAHYPLSREPELAFDDAPLPGEPVAFKMKLFTGKVVATSETAVP